MRLGLNGVWVLGMVSACSGVIDAPPGMWGSSGSAGGVTSVAGNGGSISAAGTGGSALGTAGTGGSALGTAGDLGVSNGGSANGAWCDVEVMLRERCQSCHHDPLPRAVPMTLLTRDDLAAPSASDPNVTVAQLSLTRMRDLESPMPPAPLTPATQEEIALLNAWISSEMPGDCEGGIGGAGGIPPDPYDTPVVCTSEKHWTGGDEESPNMHPGAACIACHSGGGGEEEEEEGPLFAFAGTAYPTAHEPTDCNGVDGRVEGAEVVIVDAAGKTVTLKVNSAGNFYYEARGSGVTLPYRAKIVRDGRERAMATPQESGDCNACHTESGAEDAPGRVMVP